MDGRRRTIEVDEAVADALEKRAAERGVSLDEFLSGVSEPEGPQVVLPSEELAELDARVAEWERRQDDVSADDVFDRLIDRAEARLRQASGATRC